MKFKLGGNCFLEYLGIFTLSIANFVEKFREMTCKLRGFRIYQARMLARKRVTYLHVGKEKGILPSW